ncbi:MAG: endopeptidase La [Coriobacteriales bacterium]|nr:endopeptidase La [Coriobacteriales bacterium]
MQAVPLYDVAALPGATLYFAYDHFIKQFGRSPLEDEPLVVLFQREKEQRHKLTPESFYEIAVRATVADAVPEEHVSLHIVTRADVISVTFNNQIIDAVVSDRPDINDLDAETEQAALERVRKALLGFTREYRMGPLARNFIMQFESITALYSASSNWLASTAEEKYAIIATDSKAQRNVAMEQALLEFVELQKVSNEVETAQESDHQNTYREAAIKKQMEILQSQLDSLHPENVTDIAKFEKALEELPMNEEAHAEAEKVLMRMKQEGKQGHEYGMLYDYLDFVTGLAWESEPMQHIDLNEAERILNEDHFDLEKVKSRILQHIAVMDLNKKQSGTILLFVGAPGTGKTSIGASIAKALGRKYVRVSLGGARDEADIRGHRRTYIGAMPGRIMDGIRKSGVKNPVMVLDEVDKLGVSLQGDPASALLEVLDPEQNSTFTDHYMNAPYDLSDVFFICTANSLDSIPQPLLDRMEMIQFNGYTAVDKFEIAKRHLIPKAMERAGIMPQNLVVTDDALRTIISDFTAEAGVRGLKKRLDTLCRIAAVKLVKGEEECVTVEPDMLREFLDSKPIHHESILAKKEPGIVTGLAWTRAGGDVLLIETSFTKGSGKITITGQLGDVMKESVQIAVSIVKRMFPEKIKKFVTRDLHIHVPAGAVPKDGPSAGITLTTALASLVTGNAVEPTIAMTGEVALRGAVMPIGGLPEKLMAAQRAGVKTVFIPKDNVEDLDDVAEEVRDSLSIVPVDNVKEVLKAVGVLE